MSIATKFFSWFSFGGGGGSVWVLATGSWNDTGIWIDSSTWID